MRRKDPTEWRKKFDAWKNGTPTSELFNLPKYDEGTDDKTYLPEYEYEATVTPQGTSLQKHKRITNEEDWQKYWGNVGAGYVNQAQEAAAPVVLNGMSMLMGNPVGALAGIAGSAVGEDIGAHWGPTGRAVGGLIGGIMSDNLINYHGAFNPSLFKTKLDLKYPTLAKVPSKENLSDLNVPKLSPNHWIRGNGYILGHDASLYRDKILAAEKNASDFLKHDVYPRFKRNQSHAIITNPSMLGKYGMPDIDVYYADMTNTPWGGYAHYKQSLDDIPYIVADATTDSEKLARTLTHEIEHHTRNMLNGDAQFDDLVSNATDIGDDAYKNITPVGKTEGQLLRDAYIFDEDPRFYPGKINRMRERGATNRELRHAISQLPDDKPAYYEDLDHIIDNASDEALMSLLRFGNGYSKSFYRELINRGPSASKQILQNMRNALKYVPGIIPTAIIGTSAEQAYLQEHDKGKSIHIDPANKGKLNATKKRTGKTTEQLSHSKNPLTRKRAIFALNSRKFKH